MTIDFFTTKIEFFEIFEKAQKKIKKWILFQNVIDFENEVECVLRVLKHFWKQFWNPWDPYHEIKRELRIQH